MFPGVNGFHWTVGHILFVSAFATVLLVIASTVIAALLRSRRDVRLARADAIRWHADWEDLPERDRRCRHDVAGEVIYRVCPNGFDCRRCGDHPHFAAPPQDAPADEQYGLSFPSNRYYHRGHAWAEPHEDGTVTVGLDEIADRLIGAPDHVELPAVGSSLVNNGAGWRITKRGMEVRVLSPVDGEVIETGGPAAGWYLRVRPTQWPPDLRHLLRGSEVRMWVGRELGRLQMLVTPAGAVPTMADGGVLVRDIVAQQPNADWDNVLGAVFLDP